MIRVLQAVLYDDTNRVRLTLTNEDPAGGWTLPQLVALVEHIAEERP
jgi:hypothetical protein